MTCPCDVITKVINRAVSYCRHCYVCVWGGHGSGAGRQGNKPIMTTRCRKGKEGVSGVAGI